MKLTLIVLMIGQICFIVQERKLSFTTNIIVNTNRHNREEGGKGKKESERICDFT